MAAHYVVRLVGGDVEQRLVRDGLDEAVAQKIERRASGSHGLLRRYPRREERRHAPVYLRVYGAVVDERAAGRIDEVAVGVQMARAQHVNLAHRAGDRV